MLPSYLARMGATFARAAIGPRVHALAPVRLPLRIWPSDLDVYLHLNNGRYLTLMDFGRLANSVRTGLMMAMVRNGWVPVLGAATVEYWRELRAFAQVDLVTRLTCWDDKWFYMEQRFERDGSVCAQGLVRGMCRKAGRAVAPARLMAEVGFHDPSPEPPAAIALWLESLRAARRKESAQVVTH
jgi:acyl-CoA thioesterase FadM